MKQKIFIVYGESSLDVRNLCLDEVFAISFWHISLLKVVCDHYVVNNFRLKYRGFVVYLQFLLQLFLII